MITVGVVCEYNPFHSGHAYHLSKIREKYGSECRVVCLINGNFVQRGTPAIFDKYIRAQSAVNAGADVVLELPYPFGCSGAEYFARSAVSVLSRLGIDILSFGCENDISELSAIVMRAQNKSIHKEIGSLVSSMSYAKAREEVLCYSDLERKILSLPNNILAIEYIKAMSKMCPKTEIFAIKRVGDYHHASEQGFASATQIRSTIADGDIIRAKSLCGDSFCDYEPHIESGRLPSSDFFSKAMISALYTHHENCEIAFECNAEIRDRIARYCTSCTDYDELVNHCRTARYTTARIRRALLHTTLLTPSDALTAPPYFVLLLAFSEKGKEVLRLYKKKTDITVLTKPANAYKLNSKMQKQVDMWSRADRFYALILKAPTQGDIFIRSTPFCAR